MTASFRIAVALCAVAFLTVSASAQENPFLKKAAPKDEGWKDTRVFGKRPAVKIDFWDETDEGRVEKKLSGDFPLFVVRDEGTRLRVKDGLTEGWVSKADYVRMADAVVYFTGRIDGDPKDAYAYKCRARVAISTGLPGEAQADLDALVRLAPKDPDAYRLRAFYWQTVAAYDKGVKECDALIKLQPDSFVPLSMRGDFRVMAGDYAAALADFTAAIKLDPKNGMLFVRRSEIHALRRAFGEQVADLDTALDLRPPNLVSVLAARGLARANALDVRGGLQDMKDVLRVTPKSNGDRYARACLLLLDNDADALSEFEAIRDDPAMFKSFADFASIYAHLAARQAKDDENADRALKAAVGKVKDGWPLPLIQYLEGDLGEAGVLKQAKSEGQQTEAHSAIGVHLMLKGDRDAAAKHFRWVKEKGSITYFDHTIAVVMLDRIEREQKAKKGRKDN